MLNYGYDPKMPMSLTKSNKIDPSTTEFIKNKQNLIKEAKVNIDKAN